jgi:hypothetical protein
MNPYLKDLQSFADLLAACNVIHESAVHDAEDYDGEETLCCIAEALRRINAEQSPYDIEPIREAHRKASARYEKAVQHYHQCEEDQINSFLAHNDASYWKGRRDALRHLIHFLPNAKDLARRALDSE